MHSVEIYEKFCNNYGLPHNRVDGAITEENFKRIKTELTKAHHAINQKNAEEVFSLVAKKFGFESKEAFISPNEAGAVAGRTRNKKAKLARDVSAYLLTTAYNIRPCHLAGSFGRHRSIISGAVSRVEDFRDDPKIDAVVTELEDEIDSLKLENSR